MSKIIALAFRVLQKIRGAGFSADMDFSGGSLKSQMRTANKRGARYVVIVGGKKLSKKGGILLKEREGWKMTNLEYLKSLNKYPLDDKERMDRIMKALEIIAEELIKINGILDKS